ncbi:hypothetical protein ACW0JT_15650 [Arthrobacter sp. SA17]
MYTVVTANVSEAQHKAAVGQLLEQYHRQTEQEKAIHGVGVHAEGLPLPSKYQDEIDDPEGAFAHSHVLIATDGPDVVGMLVLTVDHRASEVKRLWVAPSARGLRDRLISTSAGTARRGGLPIAGRAPDRVALA